MRKEETAHKMLKDEACETVRQSRTAPHLKGFPCAKDRIIEFQFLVNVDSRNHTVDDISYFQGKISKVGRDLLNQA